MYGFPLNKEREWGLSFLTARGLRTCLILEVSCISKLIKRVFETLKLLFFIFFSLMDTNHVGLFSFFFFFFPPVFFMRMCAFMHEFYVCMCGCVFLEGCIELAYMH